MVLAWSLLHMTNLTLGIDFRTALLWRVYMALGLALLFVPINTISFNNVPAEASNQVSPPINPMRNPGGSIWISAVTTVLARQQQVHQVYLSRSTDPGDPRFQNILEGITAGLSD